jgi:hypothetical protein
MHPARREAINEAIENAYAESQEQARTVPVPPDLGTQVHAALADDPTRTWDDAVAEVAQAERRG